MKSLLIALSVSLITTAAIAQTEEEESEGLKQRVESLEGLVAAQQSLIDTLMSQVATLQNEGHPRYTDAEAVAAADPNGILALWWRSGTSIGLSSSGIENIYLEGKNLHVNNGLGSTNTINGLGNVVVGYDESDLLNTPGAVADRSGSHNLVVGPRHSYSSYGGFIAGEENAVTGHSSSITGGRFNTVSGNNSRVGGGETNSATGFLSNVNGGTKNIASALLSTVNGGSTNTAAETGSAVGGGFDVTVPTQNSQWSWAAGGLFQE